METPHAIVGAAIATKIPNPYIALPLAFASHFVLDKIPHWNPHIHTEKKKFKKISMGTNLIITADSTLALLLCSAIALTKLPNLNSTVLVLLGSFSAVLPDAVEIPYYYFNFDFKNRYISKWVNFQKSIQFNTGIVPGLIIQFVTVIGSLYWIFKIL